MKGKRIILCIILLWCFQLIGQDKTKSVPDDKTLENYPYWIEMMQDPKANFFDTQHAFEVYWKNRKERKGAGWKPFKRWEDFMSSRVSADGLKPQAEEIWQSIQNEIAMQNMANVEGDWSELGPISLPANGTGQPNGLGRVNCLAFHPTNQDTFYIGAPAGGFWKTHDGGTSWSSNSDNLSTLGISSIAVHPNSPDSIYIGTGDRDGGDAVGLGVFLSIDGGDTWGSVNTGMGNVTVGALLIDPENPTTLLAGTSGGVFRSTNAGLSWTSTTSGNYKDLRFMPGNSSIVYGSKSGEFYRSSDNGLTWSLIGVAEGLPTSDRMVIGVTPADSSYVYAVLTSGSAYQGIYLSVDSGLTFIEKSTTPNIMDYSHDGSGTGGQAWYDLCIAVSPSDKDEVYVGGVNIFKSSDAGVNWVINAHWVGTNADAVHADHHVLEFSPVNSNLYNGNDGGVYYQTSETTTWTDISSGLAIAQCYKLGQSATSLNHVIVGYQDNGTAVYTNGAWSTEIGGDGMECIVDYTTTNYMYGSLYYGAIRRSTNGGTSFSSIAGNNVNGITESGGWVTPYTLHSTNPNTMYIGYKDIWRSINVKTNNASSIVWTEISNNLGGNTNFQVVEHSLVDTNIFYASKSSNIYRSDNVNDTLVLWQTLSSPSVSTIKDIVCHPIDTNTVYISQGSKIYESEDKGANWTDITGNIDNGDVKNCLIYSSVSGSEGIYAGSDYGVYFKPNNSSVWINYSNGLPAYPKITELELFVNDLGPSQNSLRASSYGRGLWTTSIYIDPNTPLVADFYAVDTVSCTSVSVEFIDGTAGIPNDWLWTISPNTFNFENGTDSTSQYPIVSFSAGGSYTVSLKASNLNESDSLTKTNYIEITEGESLYLDLKTDNFGSETSWTLKDGNNNTVFSGSGYSNNTLYEETLSCLVDSCYDFVINDSYGDGICCGYGSGYYILTNMDGDTVASGGSFDFTEETEVCFSPVISFIDCSSPIQLSCGETYSGNSTNFTSNNDSYSCSLLNESGPEVVHNFTISEIADITVDIVSTEELNIYILNSCSLDSCIAYGDSIISLNSLSVGSYFVVVEGTEGASGSYDLTYQQSIDISLSSTNIQICIGDSTLLVAQGAANYEWSPAVGLNVISADSVYVSPTVTTTYVVTGNTNGCESVDSLIILVNDLPDMILTSDLDSICIGDVSTLSVEGAFNYVWSPSAGLNMDTGSTVQASPVSTTTYFVTGTVAGCSSTDSITVVVNNLPDVILTSDLDSICLGDESSLSVQGALNYVWSPSIGLSIDTGSIVLASPDSTTTYIVTGTIGGCSSIDSITIVVNEIPNLVINIDNDSICSGESTLVVSTGAENYIWSPVSGLGNFSGDSVLASPTQSSWYFVQGMADGCVVVDSVFITVFDLPSLSLSSSEDSICKGESTLLIASSSGDVQWSPTVGLNTITGDSVMASPLSSTTYFATANENNCIITDSIHIEVVSLPFLYLQANDTVICFGDSTILTVSGAEEYEWSPSSGLDNTSGSSVIANPLNTTTYYIEGTTNGCASIDSITIVVNPLPILSFNSLIFTICEGDEIDLVASGADSYSWEPSLGLNTTVGAAVLASPSTTTTYWITGVVNGCSIQDSVEVIVHPNPVLNIGVSDSLICIGDSITLSATGASSIRWISSVTGDTLIGSIITVYPEISTKFYIMGETNGCMINDSILVDVVDEPLVNIQASTTAICIGDSSLLTASGAEDYVWDLGLGTDSVIGDQVYFSSGIAGFVFVEGTINNCVSVDSIWIDVIPLPSLSLNSDTIVICYGESANLIASGGGNYTWIPSLTLDIDTGMTVNAIPLISTTYYVIGESNGCKAVDSVFVEVYANPELNIVSDDSTICEGESSSISVLGADSYIWTPFNGLNVDTGNTVIASPLTTTTYTVTATLNGCISQDSITITVQEALYPSINFTNSVTCSGDIAELVGTGANNYEWYIAGDTLIGDSVFVVVMDTTQIFLSSQLGDCIYMDSLELVVENLPEVDIYLENEVVCFGDNVLLSATGATHYSWRELEGTVQGTGDSISLVPISSGYYEVSGEVNGCYSFDTIYLEVAPLPEFDILTDITTIYLVGGNNSIHFTSTADTSWFYTWDFANGDTSHLQELSYDYFVGGLYTVLLEVVDENNCRGVDSIVIEVLNNVSIEEIESLDWLIIYPNPTSGLIHLEIINDQYVIDELTMFDSSGRQVIKSRGPIGKEELLDISSEENGNYLLVFKVGESIYTRKIQKRN